MLSVSWSAACSRYRKDRNCSYVFLKKEHVFPSLLCSFCWQISPGEERRNIKPESELASARETRIHSHLLRAWHPNNINIWFCFSSTSIAVSDSPEVFSENPAAQIDLCLGTLSLCWANWDGRIITWTLLSHSETFILYTVYAEEMQDKWPYDWKRASSHQQDMYRNVGVGASEASNSCSSSRPTHAQ